MKFLYNETIASHRLAASDLSLMKSQQRPSLLNIKLKTHSLTRLNVPLETSIGFNKRSTLHSPANHVGSVDLISKIHEQTLTDEEQSCSNVPPQRRFRRAHSFITPGIINDSIVRLRRISHAQNHHRSSLQMVDQACEPKTRSSSIRKFIWCCLSIHTVSVVSRCSIDSEVQLSRTSVTDQRGEWTSEVSVHFVTRDPIIRRTEQFATNERSLSQPWVISIVGAIVVEKILFMVVEIDRKRRWDRGEVVRSSATGDYRIPDTTT